MGSTGWVQFPTLEIRWFQRGIVPPWIRGWFHGENPEVAVPAIRVDHYLRLSSDPGLGIKLREGKVEVKQCQATPELVRLHERVAGLVAAWQKWSFPLALGEGAPSVERGPPGWIAVEKMRYLHRYRITKGGEIVEVPADTYPVSGCDWELTEVHAAGATWWTIALEAFGQDDGLWERLSAVARKVLLAGEPPVLKAADSWSYPRWLASLGD